MCLVLWGISHVIMAQAATSEADRVASLRKAVIALTALATIVRLELALFVIPLALSLLINRQVGFGQVLKWGILGGFGTLCKLLFMIWRFSCSLYQLLNLSSNFLCCRLPSLAPHSFPSLIPFQVTFPAFLARVLRAHV